MDGRAIAAGAVSDAGLRRLVTEMAGPRPAGTQVLGLVARETAVAPVADGTARATRP